MLCDPDRRHRYAGAGAHDEHSLVGAQLSAGREHAPGSQEGERKRRGFGPGKRRRLVEDVARVDVDQLAGRAVRVLSQDSETGAPDVLARATPLTLPAAQGGEEDDLVALPPGGISAGVNNPGAVCRDHPWRRDTLGPVRQP